MITVNSYFCGAGLMDSGLIDAGLIINQAFEMDSDACKTYRANHGEHIKQCDIANELVLEQDSCDGMVFTYPCTKYSTIGDIHGVRTGDELFLHALRHLAVARPEFYVVENVPGMRAFPVVMEAMTKMPDYYVHIFCPIKSETWLPQRRDRLIIIGTKRSFAIRPPEHTKRITLAEILEADPDVTLPSAIAARMNGAYRDLPIISDPERGDIAPTCVAHYAKDKSTRLVADKRFPMGVRPYSVREYARLQGLKDDFVFPVSQTAAYRQIGNGVSRHVGMWIGHEVQRYMKQKVAV
ncbi:MULTISPECIES: DNA cytosine methyltransferase [Yersinia]|uniref:DNA cytosine methyltransferase n=1 Tax=Yersinia TaxID=629 RepID=UPI00119F2623|nr:DNA cytosine methyltransferase [Yersinia canariae]MCE3068250.1 DNA cytosine methyltransferase [Yersinia enterocolitica]MCE3101768.1 DNA cytosine methyltransferase [Yersinia enterocolitica]UNA05571.1 DNA-cytosine methyltransferase [Yersinia phage vB_YenM_06.16-1]UNA05644.1 DNA-cytosine methyltransferase [Yersinia phage vB_YenM_21.09]